MYFVRCVKIIFAVHAQTEVGNDVDSRFSISSRVLESVTQMRTVFKPKSTISTSNSIRTGLSERIRIEWSFLTFLFLSLSLTHSHRRKSGPPVVVSKAFHGSVSRDFYRTSTFFCSSFIYAKYFWTKRARRRVKSIHSFKARASHFSFIFDYWLQFIISTGVV